MSSIKYKSILIVDKEKEHANKIVFGDGLNIVTSTDNSVGKSSLSLMILYAFGAKVVFSDKWNISNILTKLELEKDGNQIIIERYKNSFSIFANNERYSFSHVSKYADKIYQLLGLSIKIKNKNDQFFSTAVPSIYLLPYYVPQTYQVDERSVFDDLRMYNKQDILDSMYFHVGILDENYIKALIDSTKLKKEKEKVQEELSLAENRIGFLEEKIGAFDSNSIVSPTNIDIKKDIAVFEEYSQKKREYYELLKEKERLTSQQSLLEKSKESNVLLSEKLIDADEIRCPNCDHDITDFIGKILDVGYANDRIVKELLEIKGKLLEINGKIKECEKNLEIIFMRVNDINLRRQNSALNEEIVVWNKELSSQRVRHSELKDALSNLNKGIRAAEKILKSYGEAKKVTSENYIRNYKELLTNLNVSLDDLDFSKTRLYESVKLSGSEIPRLAISKFIAYLRCKTNESIDMPILVDFPNLDLTNTNIDECFTTIFNFFTQEKQQSQSFIFSVECIERLNRIGANIINSTVINFDNLPKNESGKVRLLSKDGFIQNLDEIKELSIS